MDGVRIKPLTFRAKLKALHRHSLLTADGNETFRVHITEYDRNKELS